MFYIICSNKNLMKKFFLYNFFLELYNKYLNSSFNQKLITLWQKHNQAAQLQQKA